MSSGSRRSTGLDPAAEPECVVAEACYERWEGRGALGYLTLAAICAGQLEDPPEAARLIVAHDCFPTGVLGYWARRVAAGGLLAVLTATSPPRLGHPEGGPKLTGTNPLAIAIPSSDGRPIVSDVSMGRVTYGDVIAGAASEDELVPFGGEHAHKAFALALGLQLLVDSLIGRRLRRRDARGAARRRIRFPHCVLGPRACVSRATRDRPQPDCSQCAEHDRVDSFDARRHVPRGSPCPPSR